MNRYFGLHILEGEWHSLLPRYLLLSGRLDGRRVLDIGCGSGIGASLLLELGASAVDAIDHRPAVLELARMKHAKPGLDFHVMFWEELDFPDGTFDMVLCMDPLAPVTDPNLLKEIVRLLKPGGEYVCAIERKVIDGLEVVLPRYGYSDSAEAISVHTGTERPPQVGELQNFFAKTTSVSQRPTLSFVFEPEDGSKPILNDQFGLRDDDDLAAVELWFCGDTDTQPPPSREIRLPYYTLVERLKQVINELQMRQIRGHHASDPIFDEILDDGPSEVYERERRSTNEFRVVELDDAPTQSRIRTIRDDLADVVDDYPTFQRLEPVGATTGALESQLSELSALYHQVRSEFQSVVRDAQTALAERDQYIEHLVGTVQRWQDRFESESSDVEESDDLEGGTTAYEKKATNGAAEPVEEPAGADVPDKTNGEADADLKAAETALADTPVGDSDDSGDGTDGGTGKGSKENE